MANGGDVKHDTHAKYSESHVRGPITLSVRHGGRKLGWDRRLSVSRKMEKWGAIFFKLSTSLQLLLCFCVCLVPFTALAVSNGEGHTIHGRVKISDWNVVVDCDAPDPKQHHSAESKVFGFSVKTSNAKVILNGGQKVTFLKPDGYFSFHNVPAGTHLIEVSVTGYFFSPVRIDVSARNHGKIQAALTENRKGLNELVLEPLREEQYYEIREPFSIMSLVKSPMGLMLGFMLIVVFLMPKLMESMDPEEMRRAQEEMRSQGVPSIANFLPRSG
ncbi:hypothetical protein ACLOJK_035832 [Asimina triloba]